jgi:hypothetical protein
MNKTNRSADKAGWVLCSALVVALTGCATYVERRPHRTVYVPPPAPPPVVVAPAEPAVVVIHAESDFHEPLSPYGQWVVVGSYGHCWRPTRVAAGWRPYCDGQWRRTDAGWYWASDEPWGWATYHYGRWDWSVEFGWIWVPHTQWAPAWVSWRQGAGYVGWAPLPPAARIGAHGHLEVREPASAPQAFVFVSEQRLLEPVRPNTVIVNNTTVVNRTVNITKVQVVNKTVINEGPRPEIIERRSGRKIEAFPVRELRRREETEIVKRRPNQPSTAKKELQQPAPALAESAQLRNVPARELRQVEKPAETTKEAPVTRNEFRKPAVQKPAPPTARPEVERPQRALKRQNLTSETPPAEAKVKPLTRPDQTVVPRETRPVERPSEAARRPHPPAKRDKVSDAGELKSSAKPARPEGTRSAGNERQRELERVKGKPARGQHTLPANPDSAPTNRPAAKRKIPGKEKPAANQPDEADKKKV